MRLKSLFLPCVLTLLLAAQSAFAVSSYGSRIPNGSRYGCDTCHDLVRGAPARNPFGTAFANNGHAWNAALANLDSDGDGAKNGVELGDPTGSGTPTPGAQVTNPGDPSSKPSATAPSITTQPVSRTVTEGANVTFTVGASGTSPLSYQWRKNGGNIAGATGSSLALNSVTSSDAGSYTVRVSNSAGSATSATATLTVNPAAVAPSITTQPASQTVTAGANVTFTAAANGTAPLSYQWRKNGGNIAGATGTSLALTSVTSSDAGSYTVRVSNSAGSVTSAAATLTVNPAPVAPSITTQPASQTVIAGANVTFTVGASGTAPLSYQWRKNGGNIAGATGTSLVLNSVTSSDAGSYTVRVSNSAGSVTSASATLTVNPAVVAPTITTQPASQSVSAGANVTFTVAASGTAPLSYQWRKNGGNIAGATGTSLVLNGVTSSDAGSYTVRVSNSAGSVTSATATLTVNPAVVAPTITTQPASQSVSAGANVTFTVGASGTAPLSYQWRKNGGNIAGATGSSLALNNVATSDAGSYTVQVSNSAGSATSANATLTVNALVTVPSITTQPASQTVTAGANVTFTVGANGTAPLSYQWRKNGTDLIGATDSSLVRNNITSADAGSYAVRVSNAAGSVMSANAMLTVNPAPIAPSITTQPASQTVDSGANVTFTVAASGTAPLSYQWRKNGGIIAGATGASLALSSVSTTDAGNYTVQVSNSAGSVTSATATLTVNAAPVTLGITLVSPTNGANFVWLSEVELTAAVSSANAIVAVDFFDGTNLCGTVTAAPYSMTVSNLSVGEHVLSAVVTDSEDAMAVSEPVTIMIGSAPQPPSQPTTPSAVQMVTPADGATFTAPARIILAARVAAPRNAVRKVEFFSGSTSLGTGTRFSERDDDEASEDGPGGTAYLLVWNRVPAGSYNITAEVTYRGRRKESDSSAPVHVAVTGATVWPGDDHDDHDEYYEHRERER